MKRIISLLLTISILLLISIPAMAENTDDVPEFYTQSLKTRLIANSINQSDIQAEVYEQAMAVLEINRISSDLKLEDIDLSKAVNTVFIKSYDSEESSLGTETDQLKSAGDIVNEKQYVTTFNMYNTPWVDYYWKLPVLETDNEYLYATIIIQDEGEYSISTTFVPYKTLSDATYLFDRTLVTDTLTKNGYDIEKYLLLPVSIPSVSTDAILFADGQIVYALPYSSRPDMLGIDNGTIYDFDAFNEIVYDMFKDSYGEPQSEPAGGGNGSWRDDTGKNTGRWILIGVIAVLIAGGAVTAITAVKKRRNS